MSDEQQTANGAGDDALAGELVLGVLSPERRAAALARVETDAVFAAKVASWEQKLSPLADEIAPVAPPTRVWKRIEGDLFTGETPRPGLWSNLAFWRWLAAGSSLAAAASLAVLITIGTPQPEINLVAALQASDAGPSYVAKIEAGSGQLLISAVSAPDDEERVPELWLIPEDGVPRSLGVIAESGDTRVVIPSAMRDLAARNAVLAITLEPQGGAPEGKPTGPVIAAGKLQKL